MIYYTVTSEIDLLISLIQISDNSRIDSFISKQLSHDEADVGLPTEMADLGEIRGGDAPPPPSLLVGLGGGEVVAMALFWKALRPLRPL